MSAPNNTAVAVIPREQKDNQIQVINNLLSSDRVKGTIKTLIPQGSHLTSDRVVKVVLAAVLRNPDLLKCSGTSIVRSATRACEVGLEPGGVLGHAYLVPMRKYKDNVTTFECEMWLGYQGALELMRRSAQVSTIYAEVVKPGDFFDWQFGLEPTLIHRPDLQSMDPNIESIAVYAVAHLKDGGRQFIVMSRAQIEAIRLKSSGGAMSAYLAKKIGGGAQEGDPMGAWASAWDEQAKKTALKRLYKVMPKSVLDLNMADKIHEMMSNDEDGPPTVVDIPQPEEDEGEPPNPPPPVAINAPPPAADPPRRGRPPGSTNATPTPRATKPVEVNPSVVPPAVDTVNQPQPTVPYGAELDAIAQPGPKAAAPPPPTTTGRKTAPSSKDQEEFDSMFPPDEGERL